MPAFSTDDVLGNRLDFEIARDGFVRGLVLVLSGFDRFAQRLPRTADHVQHILRRQGRYAALFGNRLLTILA